MNGIHSIRIKTSVSLVNPGGLLVFVPGRRYLKKAGCGIRLTARMSDIYDYIEEKGDRTFSEEAFNEVDALVFAWLSYFEIEKLEEAGVECRGMRLPELVSRAEETLGEFKKPDILNKLVSAVTGAWMLGKAAQKRRYSDVVIGDYSTLFDPENSIQFSATSYDIGRNTWVIAYRGTDTSVAGWKEDCLTSFSQVVPSQELALEFLESCHAPRRRIILTGHSKGGNLAIYAAAKSHAKNIHKVKDIYNFDGPGFCFDIRKTRNYPKIKNHIHSFIPGSSIVGMLLNHMDDYTIVASSNVGIMQHYAFYWKIEDGKFVTQDKLSASSRSMERAVKQWLRGLSFEKRRAFVETVFSVFEDAGIEDFSSLSAVGFGKMKEIFFQMKNMDEQTRKMARSFFRALVKAYKRELKASAVETYDKVKDMVVDTYGKVVEKTIDAVGNTPLI